MYLFRSMIPAAPLRKTGSWLVALAALLTACNLNNSPLAAKTIAPSPTVAAELTVTPDISTPNFDFTATVMPVLPSETPFPVSNPTALPEQSFIPAVYPLTHYRLDASLDFPLRKVSVFEEITYTHAVDEPLDRLVLVVEANRYADCFQIIQMNWGDGSVVTDYQLQGNRLEIQLSQPANISDQVILSISYELALPAIPPPEEGARPQPFGYTSRQVNLVDWYPYLPPYQPGEGWLIHTPWFFGEHQVYEVADYAVEIRLEGTGEVAGQPILIAASAPAREAQGIYKFQLEKARNFVWSASPVYQVLSERVGDVNVESFAFTFHSEGSQAVLRHTVDAVRLYQELFAPYPHASLSIVEADFMDGMEYDGLYFLSRGFYNLYEGTPDGYLTAIAVHETAHQWWYGLVGNDQALEPWLDEALCTYSEKLFYEKMYPELVDWWWSFRVNYYRPAGPVDGEIFDYAGFWPYRDAVYLRGALFLEDLRQAVGDEVFFTFLHDYATRLAYQRATAQSFFEILKRHTSVDFSGLLSDYFQEGQ